MQTYDFPDGKIPLGQLEHGCPLCDNQEITLTWTNQIIDYGTGEKATEIPVRVPVLYCELCDFEYLDKYGAMVKHEAVCRYHGILTPNEIKQIRKSLGYTKEGFAKLTKIGIASLNRWESGSGMQSHSHDNYLRLLQTNPDLIEILEGRLTPHLENKEVPRNQKFPHLFQFHKFPGFKKILAQCEGFHLTPQSY